LILIISFEKSGTSQNSNFLSKQESIIRQFVENLYPGGKSKKTFGFCGYFTFKEGNMLEKKTKTHVMGKRYLIDTNIIIIFIK
jgi:hypothetical protein